MMTRGLLIAAAALFANGAAPAPAADRASVAALSARAGFDAGEDARVRAASTGEAGAARALAGFYALHGLWPETLAALARLTAPDKDAEMLAAEAEYRLGRYRRVLARTAGVEPAGALRAMALARLGAYAAAAAAFDKAQPPKGLEAEHHLAAAEARVFSDDPAAALQALDAASVFGLAKSETARFQFLRAQIHLKTGETQPGRAMLRRAAKNRRDEWSMRASLALAGDVEALDQIALKWRGAAFDRDHLMATGAMRLSKAELEQGFAAYARVAYEFPESDAAIAAQAAISANIGRLFSDGAALSVEDVARVFFDYVEFAPPGREGDGLIRQAAERLKALGLYREAAALIDHQVFKRLRGADRARVAADLADLHLAAQAPDAALGVLRATRIAGLGAETNARRRRLEATALATLGRREAAVALLEYPLAPSELQLRASINWDSERWAEAAADYASVFAASASGPASEGRAAAVRAATAYLLAGDRAGYRAFVNGAGPRLAGTAEERVIRSLGDVDRDAFLSRFMENYRALYATAAGEG